MIGGVYRRNKTATLLLASVSYRQPVQRIELARFANRLANRHLHRHRHSGGLAFPTVDYAACCSTTFNWPLHRRIIRGKATVNACTRRQTSRHHDDRW